MQKKIPFSTYAVIGTMLFGLYFGAGNLIFPIQLGQLAGTNFWFALVGFLVTAIGLPFLGILAIGLSGSNGLRDLASRIHPLFGVIFSLALYLTIGPFFAIPRTATVPFVVGFEPYINAEHTTMLLALFSFIFFAIVYYFSLNPAKIMDYIGKVLTPAFLVVLFILIIISIVKPMGHFQQPIGDYIQSSFMTGFKEGYNTMDALASLAFGIVVINAIKNAGITDRKEIAKATWKSGIFAMALMTLIYGLITYMGASSIESIGTFDNGGLIFAAVADHYFGSFGAILLAVIIVLACLKTSIGLITSCSEFFHEVFPKVSYKMFVLLLCVVSFSIANFGLNNIIQFAIPVLMFLYPLAIVLILLALSSSLFNNKQAVYASAMFLTFFVSLIDGYKALVISIPGAQLSLLDTVEQLFSDVLPLYDIGLGWILPAMIGVVIGLILPSKQTKIIH
ncbi:MULTISPECIES: branched-chain amino acid transport system II carrier protein [Lysinibacillus]|uniref:Branched-chain amino acid transport system carrier protein n=2 Tax=Lysinibacillus TaxID=400634 RepID=A0ABY2T8F4_9BACI|nr:MULTISPECIES: branched-chain amino acid transport system II carrier protein [Lysinibacillus]AHN21556.1 branched-chain amino acid transporter [Lysinibacillus varians]MCS1382246.1 branched-chain amino acid transport system II carrier protein [Lysinibacillus sphaericus]TKI47695.1 branched-chain amino acid transport system II carrier protein [Lysinibacillus tabacifolii]TKI59863.1 branched-chain amino acid transport system II carrier protein [Lysinibacillus varians]